MKAIFEMGSNNKSILHTVIFLVTRCYSQCLLLAKGFFYAFTRIPEFIVPKPAENIRQDKLASLKIPTPRHIKDIFFHLSPTERYVVSIAAAVVVASMFGMGIQYYLGRTQPAPARGGDYVEAMIGLPRFINPVLAAGSDVDRDISRLIYPSLLTYDARGNLVPDLSESFEIQNDGKRYRFPLKKNAVWEDGKPITAADVIFTIKVIQDPKYSSPIRQNWLGVNAEEESGGQAVIFDLSSPYAPFPENATVGILPKHVWENVAPNSFLLAEANLKPVGGGPYKFEKFQKDSSGYILSYMLKRNARAYGEKPFLDSITFKFFENEDMAVNAYNNRVVDGISFISASSVDKINAKEQTSVHSFTLPRYFALFFNQNKHPALQSAKVREALGLGTDKETLVNDILGGQAEKIDTPLPGFTQDNGAETAHANFDLAKAREILDNEKWIDENGDGIREKKEKKQTEAVQLDFTIATVAWPELEDVAIELKKQWLSLGVNVNIELYQIGELQQNIIRAREYQILLLGQVLGPNPDPFSFWHSSQKKDPGLNLALYENKDVDKLLEDARKEQNVELRKEKLQKFQTLVAKDIPAVFLYNPYYLYPVSKNIKGIEDGILADPSWRFAQAGKWYVKTARRWK